MAKTLRSIVLYLYRMVTESLLKIQISLNTAASPSRICHFVELVIERPYTGGTRLILSLSSELIIRSFRAKKWLQGFHLSCPILSCPISGQVPLLSDFDRKAQILPQNKSVS